MKRKAFLKQLGGLSVLSLLATSLVQAAVIDPKLSKSLEKKIIRNESGKVFDIFGNKQVHKLVGADTNNQFFEWIDYLKPGAGIPMHTHTKEDEIFRVQTGTVEFTIGETSSILQKGDIAFAPKNIPHAWRVLGDRDAQMLVSVYPAGMEFMFEKLDALPKGKPDLEKVASISAEYGIHFIK